MAKNEQLEKTTLVTSPDEAVEADTGGPSIKDVQYLRKDTHMLLRGTWYITLTCPHHGTPTGMVDEEISWAEAKTPHHAAVIAEQRHADCNKATEEEMLRLVAAQEIEAAKDLRRNQAHNLQAARERAEACAQVCKASPGVRVHEVELQQALHHLKRHEHGMLEAEKRVANTVADNER